MAHRQGMFWSQACRGHDLAVLVRWVKGPLKRSTTPAKRLMEKLSVPAMPIQSGQTEYLLFQGRMQDISRLKLKKPWRCSKGCSGISEYLKSLICALVIFLAHNAGGSRHGFSKAVGLFHDREFVFQHAIQRDGFLPFIREGLLFVLDCQIARILKSLVPVVLTHPLRTLVSHT